MQITLDVPERYLTTDSPAQFAERLKLYAALLMFQSGELSVGAACELAGVDRYTFIRECDRRGIAVVNYPPEDLQAELDSLLAQRPA